MKINKNFIRYSAGVLLLLTILPLFLEAGTTALPLTLIIVGVIGSWWCSGRLYNEVKWKRVSS